MLKLMQIPVAMVVAVTLLACGGGGGGFSGDDDPGWTQGVFQDESLFKNKCANPRSGTDPFSGASYPDQQGSVLLENHWLRSWSHNTYLWYDEIIDQDPALFSDPIAYFDLLKTEALTPSGNPKDQFHFTYDTAEWQALTQSGVQAGYGVRWAVVNPAPPRKVVVAYTEPNSPATSLEAALARGAEVLEVDGIDVINAGDQASVDAINAALFPADINETHTFVVRDRGASTTRTFTMTSSEITKEPVKNVATLDTGNGIVGYLTFNTHIQTSEEALVNAITQLAAANIDDLVLDLRYNGGGLLDIASELAYMIAGSSPTAGRTFEKLTFNDQHPTINPVTGETITPTPFHSTAQGFSVASGTALPSLNLNRVYILSTDSTCSASEAIINGLRGVDFEVILIGGTTCGKPYGFYPTDNCGTTYFTIQFRGENDKGFGDYADGFTPQNATNLVGVSVPGCAVADDFDHALGDSQEAMFAAALSYRADGSCPTPPASKRSVMADKYAKGSLFNSQRYRDYHRLSENRILN